MEHQILRKADLTSVPDMAKQHGGSEQTLCIWRKKFVDLDQTGLKQLEQENPRLKKLVAERDIEVEVMKEIAAKKVSAPVRREQVTYATARGLSQRRACQLLSVARSTLGYASSRLAVKDAPVKAAMHRLAGPLQRFGYRRILVFLDRKG